MIYPYDIVKKLKEWFGWDDDMIEMIRKAQQLRLMYRIMLKEKENK